MTTEKQHRLFKKHEVERLELSMEQALDWVKLYESEDNENLTQSWRKTYEHRRGLFLNAMNAKQNDSATE